MLNLIGILVADLILAQVKERPQFGEEHMVDYMDLRPGGAANMIYPLAQLGVKPRVIATLGKDEFGKKILEEMAPLIEDRLIYTESPTSISTAIVHQTGARFFVTYSGNLYDLNLQAVEQIPEIDEAKATFFFGYFLTPNFGFEGTLATLQRVKKKGQLTFFDASSDIGGWQDETCKQIFALLPHIDYFMPNDDEIFHLTKKPTIEQAVQFLMEQGAKCIILKKGSKGATAYTDHLEIHHPGYPTQAFDTTGAGDSFNAGFVHKIMQGSNIKEALAFGNALASIVVSRKENRYPTLAEIEERMNSTVSV